jgi:hypothetical protein
MPLVASGASEAQRQQRREPVAQDYPSSTGGTKRVHDHVRFGSCSPRLFCISVRRYFRSSKILLYILGEAHAQVQPCN